MHLACHDGARTHDPIGWVVGPVHLQLFRLTELAGFDGLPSAIFDLVHGKDFGLSVTKFIEGDMAGDTVHVSGTDRR